MYRRSSATDFLKRDCVPGTRITFKGAYKHRGFTLTLYHYRDKDSGKMQWHASTVRRNGARAAATAATLKGVRSLMNRWINQFPHEAPAR